MLPDVLLTDDHSLAEKAKSVEAEFDNSRLIDKEEERPAKDSELKFTDEVTNEIEITGEEEEAPPSVKQVYGRKESLSF